MLLLIEKLLCKNKLGFHFHAFLHRQQCIHYLKTRYISMDQFQKMITFTYRNNLDIEPWRIERNLWINHVENLDHGNDFIFGIHKILYSEY